jgi:hypothetical protein
MNLNKLLKRVFLLIILPIFINTVVTAQVVTTNPVVPVTSQPFTLTFYADRGTAGLKDYNGTVYCHTGIITDKSANNTDWKYVKSEWGENLPELQLTRKENNRWEFTTGTKSIREFYNVPDEEQILRIAFVFRSGEQTPEGGYYEGKDEGGTDIFVEVSNSLYNIKVSQPVQNSLYVAGQNIPVKVEASQAGDMKVYCYINNGTTTNGGLIHNGTVSGFDTTLTNAQRGFYTIIAQGESGGIEDADTVTFLVRGASVQQAIPAGMQDGINYHTGDPTKVTLVLRAPWKDHVFVIGDFNNWQLTLEHQMKYQGDGDNPSNPKKFWVTIENLKPGVEYAFQYIVDDSIYITDPYCEKVLDPWNDRYIKSTTYPNLKPFPQGARIYSYAGIFQTNQKKYNWVVPDFTAPPKDNLVIYELLMRDFMDGICSYDQLRDTLTYLQRLGINAIELMPVMEFDGNESWGYNPAFYFAPDKAYGTANSLKRLIDECHRRGIAVILDIVLNHSFGNSPTVKMWWDPATNKPLTSNPYHNVNATHPWNVGEDFNHESPHTQYLVERIVKYWLQEYNIDGYRFDLSKGFTQQEGTWEQYDESRINIVKRIAGYVRSAKPDAYIILEHWGTDEEENVYANDGIMCWRNITKGGYNFAMGWGTEAYMNRMSGTMNNFVSFLESHDEERVIYECLTNGNGVGGYSIKDSITALGRMALASTMLYGSSGPKMMWQFGELGYPYSIGQCWDTALIHLERCRTDRKPVRWDYLKQPARKKLYDDMCKLINLKTHYAGMDRAYDWDYHESVNGNNLVKWQSLKKDDYVVISMANGDVVPQSIPVTMPNGRYFELFSGDSIDVVNGDWTFTDMQAGEYRVYTRSKVEQPDIVVPPDVYPTLTVKGKDNVTYSKGCIINIEGEAANHDSIVVLINDEVVKVYKGLANFNYSDSLRAEGEFRLAVMAVNQYGEEIRSFSYKVVDGDALVEFISPTYETVTLGTVANVVLQGTNTDRITLYHNNYQVATVENNSYLDYRLAGISDTGTHRLRAVGVAACSSHEIERTLKVVKPKVTLTPSISGTVAIGSEITITAEAPLADSIFFSYQKGNVFMAKQGNALRYTIYGITQGVHVFTATAKGKYYDNTPVELTVNVAAASNEEIESASKLIKVYPNPAGEGILNVISQTNTGAAYILVNMNGKAVRKGKISDNGTVKIDVKELKAGLYVLKVGSENVKVVIK